MTRKSTGCPLCGATPAPAHTPFCSQGCRDRDLLNWLGETYRVPSRHTESEDDDPVANGLDSTG